MCVYDCLLAIPYRLSPIGSYEEPYPDRGATNLKVGDMVRIKNTEQAAFFNGQRASRE